MKRTSGKRSASSSAGPPERAAAPAAQPVLFIDRCAWSHVLGEALAAAAIPYVAHPSRFRHDTPDDEWLAQAADEAWLVVTRDRRIRYRVNELRAAVQARLHLFVFTQGGLRAVETAQILVQAYPAILRCVASRQPPAFWSLQRGGAVVPLRFSGL